jgi:hypothetical protein
MRSVTIRLAGPGDLAALTRLAALDSARILRGDVLLGLVDDEPWAALSLTDGAAVADPFRRSGAVVALLRERARLFDEARPRRRGAGRLARAELA